MDISALKGFLILLIRIWVEYISKSSSGYSLLSETGRSYDEVELLQMSDDELRVALSELMMLVRKI